MVALVGPTASGKSEVAHGVAHRWGATVISVDSMQVYRGMDIGTAKPTRQDQDEVDYRLIDVADPSEEYSVARYQLDAGEVLAACSDRPVLLVGGTGLYLRVLIDGLNLPGQWPEVRAGLEQKADEEGAGPLHEELRRLDPLAASRMEPSNRRRVVRALEVTLGSGRPFSSYGPGLDRYPESSVQIIGLDRPREELDERIARRYRAQMASGFLAEVETLLTAAPSATARQALGYRELIAHLERGLPLDDALDQAVARTRRFARRQLAWFRRDPRVRWVGRDENAVSLLSRALGECCP